LETLQADPVVGSRDGQADECIDIIDQGIKQTKPGC
jgi:hypothetical protein